MILILVCTSLVGCINNTIENKGGESIKLGKNITIVIPETEIIDSTYLQNVLDGAGGKNCLYFDAWEAKELAKLIDYMDDNNYIIKPGTYTFNQAWTFDNGEFVINNGEKRTIFEFQQLVQ